MIPAGFALLLLGQQRTIVRFEDLPKPGAQKSIMFVPIQRSTLEPVPFKLPPGFKIELFASKLLSPRTITVAPGGDVFVLEPYRGRLEVLSPDGRERHIFANGFTLPHGVVFHGGYLYVANTDSIVRFKYRPGQKEAEGSREMVMDKIPTKGYNQHWTRNFIFDPTGTKMFVTVGSETNHKPEPLPRASILVANADGSGRREYITGMRNPTGMAYRPGTNELWVTCIERDYMGNDLVPDYMTQIHDGEYYGWPFYYLGNHRDYYNKGVAPKRKVRVPDILFTAHSVPLNILFYTGKQFPRDYVGDALLPMRGSTNRKPSVGYKVVRVHFENGKPTPGYTDFITGWCPNPLDRHVYGRPVGIAQMPDGSILIGDEGAGKLYRVSYVGPPR